MIPVKHDHGRLPTLFQGGDQFSGKLVHLINHVHVILPRIHPALVLDTAHDDTRVVKHPLRRVIAVPLHADRHHEVRSLRRVKRVHDMGNQHVVRRPPLLRQLQDVHEFLARIMVEPHMVEHLCPTIKIPPVIVQGFRAVPDASKRGRRALHDPHLRVRLIRVFARPEKTHAHARQHLELRVGSSRADGRGLEIAGRIFL